MCGSNQPMKQAALEGARSPVFTGGGPGGFPGAMLGMFVQARKQAGQLKNPTGHTFVDYLTRDNPQIRDQINAAVPQSSSPSGGPTRLGIGRRPSARKRSGVSGRSRSRSKAFSSTKR